MPSYENRGAFIHYEKYEFSEICKTGKVLRSELSDYKDNYYRIKTVKNSGKIYTFLFVNGELAMSYTEENK